MYNCLSVSVSDLEMAAFNQKLNLYYEKSRIYRNCCNGEGKGSRSYPVADETLHGGEQLAVEDVGDDAAVAHAPRTSVSAPRAAAAHTHRTFTTVDNRFKHICTLEMVCTWKNILLRN